MFKSHLTVLESTSSRYLSSPIFRVPELDASKSRVHSWRSITYKQFRNHVELFAKHWIHVLTRSGIPQRSTVGVWLGGFSYTDILHIYGISRAGYIPQLFSLRLPNPVVVYELLHKAGANALVYDSTFGAIVKDCPVACYTAPTIGQVDAQGLDEALPELPTACDSEVVLVFHTSGSTSGSPKLVPCSYRWLDTVVKKSFFVCKPRNPDRQDVTVAMGSMCHIAQTFMLIGSIQHGSCVVLPTKQAFSSEELVDIIDRCSLNRLNQFSSFLGKHLRASRTDLKLQSLLAQLDSIMFTGLPLAHEEEKSAYEMGFRLINLFGSTECAVMLHSGSDGRNPSLLQPMEGFSYRFVPIAQTQSESVHQSNARLLELVIPADSPDCPNVSLRHPDGDFHTGDLFQEVIKGQYIFRGRDDDWIKSENSLRCDTKAIEDNARGMCGNDIAECIVVGSGRPSPVIFVEPAEGVDHAKLKKDIFRKTRQFHSRRYLHESITSADMIVIVPPRTLPRTTTKGNIRRQAVEETFKTQLDKIFGVR